MKNALTGSVLILSNSEHGVKTFFEILKKKSGIKNIKLEEKDIENTRVNPDTKFKSEYLGSYFDIENKREGYLVNFEAKTDLDYRGLLFSVNDSATRDYNILDKLRNQCLTAYFDLTIEIDKVKTRRIVKVDFSSPGSVTDLETLVIIDSDGNAVSHSKKKKK